MKNSLLAAYGHLRRGYHAVRSLPDRMRHGSRHRSVCRRIAEMHRPRTLLVVCYGNICRSPYLEAVLKRDLRDISVASAGFVGPNRPVPEHSLEVSARRGLDLSAFRSSTLQPRRASTADLVLVMDEGQARHLAIQLGIPRARIVIVGDLDPERSSTRAIRDPWQQSIDVFESSFDRLDRCAATLTRLLRVADPGKARQHSHSGRPGQRSAHERAIRAESPLHSIT